MDWIDVQDNNYRYVCPINKDNFQSAIWVRSSVWQLPMHCWLAGQLERCSDILRQVWYAELFEVQRGRGPRFKSEQDHFLKILQKQALIFLHNLFKQTSYSPLYV